MKLLSFLALATLIGVNLFFYLRRPVEAAPTFANIKVVFLCLGKKDMPHIIPYQQGLARAKRDFACDLKVWWVGGERGPILENFKRAIDGQPDAICVPGFEDEEGYEELVEEALSKGIRVTFYRIPMPVLRQKYASSIVGFVGQNQYEAGRKLAQRAGFAFGLNEISSVWILGNSRKESSIRRRTQGLADYIREIGITPIVVDMGNYWYSSPPENMSSVLSNLIAEYGIPDCILHDAAGMDMLVDAFKQCGIAPGTIQVATTNSSSLALQALVQNYAQLALVHDFSQQSYLSVLQACMGVKFGMRNMDITLPESFADTNHLDSFKSMINGGE